MPKILIVDDEKAIRMTLKEILEFEKYEVDEAQDGAEALVLIKKNDYDVVLSDVKMPKMTGVELLEEVVKIYPDIIKIILTGFTDVEDIMQALNKCGIYRYLMKPWEKAV